MKKSKHKKIILNETLDEAIVWQELCEKLARIYKDDYSYTNILESLLVAKAVFYENLKEDENEKTCC